MTSAVKQGKEALSLILLGYDGVLRLNYCKVYTMAGSNKNHLRIKQQNGSPTSRLTKAFEPGLRFLTMQ